ncbi:hypothetical protein [Kordiimonas sp. SCSIO 12610]|uniref:hypothetical protein n=1 Tax=Kordiimonas sp. SCSIO 12610 TaxID=2829597 RepID=UPI002109728E|nr:hypothetical protein [Kordiimonas sp. SCSIO 12610]UTW55056.1 hypothetical protein KFF44_14800 [Kordiimonas sp. SCSIO 12610]
MRVKYFWEDIGDKIAIFVLRVLSRFREDPNACDHEWEVYSTALNQGWLELTCHKCMSNGAVEDPTKEEWEKAFDASSSPYRWYENERVTLGQRIKI